MAAYAFNAIHIEFASSNKPLTNDQLHYGTGRAITGQVNTIGVLASVRFAMF